jgi:beta-lactamase class A
MDSSVLEWLLAGIGRSGAVCVLDLDRPGVVELCADHVVQTGSTFKIAVCLEVYGQAHSGELDLAERLRFDAERAPVSDPTVDEAAALMMRLSDNAATAALMRRVTHDRIMSRLTALGPLHTTVGDVDVVTDVARITAALDQLARSAGFTDWHEPIQLVHGGQYAQIADRLARIAVDEDALPHDQLGRTSTARELASLYALIWRDEAASPEVCAAVREAVSHQQLARLQLGFPAPTGVAVAGKGGSIPGVINNDAGVITYPDGHRYAAAVFTRARQAFAGNHASYQTIGALAATAVDLLRTRG